MKHENELECPVSTPAPTGAVLQALSPWHSSSPLSPFEKEREDTLVCLAEDILTHTDIDWEIKREGEIKGVKLTPVQVVGALFEKWELPPTLFRGEIFSKIQEELKSGSLGPHWTAEERENVRHFLASIRREGTGVKGRHPDAQAPLLLEGALERLDEKEIDSLLKKPFNLNPLHEAIEIEEEGVEGAKRGPSALSQAFQLKGQEEILEKLLNHIQGHFWEVFLDQLNQERMKQGHEKGLQEWEQVCKQLLSVLTAHGLEYARHAKAPLLFRVMGGFLLEGAVFREAMVELYQVAYEAANGLDPETLEEKVTAILGRLPSYTPLSASLRWAFRTASPVDPAREAQLLSPELEPDLKPEEKRKRKAASKRMLELEKESLMEKLKRESSRADLASVRKAHARLSPREVQELMKRNEALEKHAKASDAKIQALELEAQDSDIKRMQALEQKDQAHEAAQAALRQELKEQAEAHQKLSQELKEQAEAFEAQRRQVAKWMGLLQNSEPLLQGLEEERLEQERKAQEKEEKRGEEKRFPAHALSPSQPPLLWGTRLKTRETGWNDSAPSCEVNSKEEALSSREGASCTDVKSTVPVFKS